MDYNRNLSETLAVLAYQCANQAVGAVTVGPFSTALQRRVLFNIVAGTPGASGTINAKVQASATQGGTYADVAGAAITALTAAGVAELEVKAESLTAAGVGPWIQLICTVGTATSPVAVLVQGAPGRYEPNGIDNSVTGTATPVVY